MNFSNCIYGLGLESPSTEPWAMCVGLKVDLLAWIRVCGDRSCSQEQLLVCGHWLSPEMLNPVLEHSGARLAARAPTARQGLLSEGEQMPPLCQQTFALTAASTGSLQTRCLCHQCRREPRGRGKRPWRQGHSKQVTHTWLTSVSLKPR